MAELKEKQQTNAEQEEPKKTSLADRIRKNLKGLTQKSPYALDEAELQNTTPEDDVPSTQPGNPFTLSEAEQQQIAAAQVATEQQAEPESAQLQVQPLQKQPSEVKEAAVQATEAAAVYDRPKSKHKRHWYGVPLGALVLVFAMVGFGWLAWQGGRYLYGVITDDSKERAYDEYLKSVVMFDPEPFETPAAADKSMIQRAAVWKTVFENIGVISEYDDQYRLIVPADLVRANAVKLFGVDCVLTPESFSMGDGDSVTGENETIVQYMQRTDDYHVPLIESVGTYQPYTVSRHVRDNVTTLRVAYCIVLATDNVETDAELLGEDKNLAVVKYMEYEIAYDRDTNLEYIQAIRVIEE